MYDIFVAIPCKIIKYDGRVADVKPLTYQYKELPIITCAPVALFGNKSANIHFNLKPDDIVLAIFPQLDISQLVGAGLEGEVICTERFNLTNCIVLPFGIPTLKDAPKISTADFDIEGDINITGTLNITGFLKINGIDFSTHVHAGVTPGTGVTAIPTPGGV